MEAYQGHSLKHHQFFTINVGALNKFVFFPCYGEVGTMHSTPYIKNERKSPKINTGTQQNKTKPYS